MNGAACKGMGDLFFSDDHHDNTRAKAICATCACQPECLAQAMRDREEHGVFGGYTARERWRMSKGLKPEVKAGRPKQHGTRGQYVMGCRCPECVVADREYQREYHEQVRRPRRLRLV